MQCTVVKINPVSDATVNVHVILAEDNGAVVFEGDVAVSSVETDAQELLKYVKQSFRNKFEQIKKEKSAIIKPELQKLVGTTFKIA